MLLFISFVWIYSERNLENFTIISNYKRKDRCLSDLLSKKVVFAREGFFSLKKDDVHSLAFL